MSPLLLGSPFTLQKDEDWPDYFLHPDDPFWIKWNYVLVVGVVYMALFIPVRVGFMNEQEKGGVDLDLLLAPAF